MHFGSNIRLLRQRRQWSQSIVADEIGVKRNSLSGYESGSSQPTFMKLLAISDLFRVSIDKLLRYDLSSLSERQLSDIEKGFDIDIKGERLRVLATTIGMDDEENIELVSETAKAGYTTGFSDPEYISSLPVFRLPHLARQKKYRAFPISGDSMPPVSDGSIVIGEYLEDWSSIKDGSLCILITRNDGIVFKKVFNQLSESGKFMLVSTNPTYAPFYVEIPEILEVWKFNGYVSQEFDEEQALPKDQMSEVLKSLQQEVAAIRLELRSK